MGKNWKNENLTTSLKSETKQAFVRRAEDKGLSQNQYLKWVVLKELGVAVPIIASHNVEEVKAWLRGK